MYFNLQKLAKFGLALIITMILATLPLAGQSSAYVGVFGEYLTTQGSVGSGVQGSYDYRTSLGSVGYLKFSSLGELSYDFSTSEISDFFSVDIENMWFIEDNELAITAGSQFSFSGYGDTAAHFSPDWDVTYRIFRGYRKVNPNFSYFGYASESQVFNGVRVGMEQAPKVEFSYDLSLGAGVDSYFDTPSPDIPITLSGGINGLVGYTINWDLWGRTSYRISEEDMRQGFSGSVAGQMMFTPSRLFQVYLAPAWYWSYLTGSESLDMSVEIATRADLALEDSLYLYVGPSFVMDHIQDSAQLETSMAITIGLDIAL